MLPLLRTGQDDIEGWKSGQGLIPVIPAKVRIRCFDDSNRHVDEPEVAAYGPQRRRGARDVRQPLETRERPIERHGVQIGAFELQQLAAQHFVVDMRNAGELEYTARRFRFTSPNGACSGKQ